MKNYETMMMKTRKQNDDDDDDDGGFERPIVNSLREDDRVRTYDSPLTSFFFFIRVLHSIIFYPSLTFSAFFFFFAPLLLSFLLSEENQ